MSLDQINTLSQSLSFEHNIMQNSFDIHKDSNDNSFQLIINSLKNEKEEKIDNEHKQDIMMESDQQSHTTTCLSEVQNNNLFEFQNKLDTLIKRNVKRKMMVTNEEREICKLVKLELVFQPNKLIPLQTAYWLKNSEVINESWLKNPQVSYEYQKNQNKLSLKQYSYNKQDLEKKVEIQGLINNFKYLDYILYENIGSKDPQKPQFLDLKFKEYSNTIVSPQYLIERFKSFGDKHFLQYAQLIQKLEDDYQNFKNSKYNLLIKQETMNKNLTYIQYIAKKQQEIYCSYPNKYIKINHFRSGLNSKIIDISSMSFNIKLIELLEYTIESFSKAATQKLGIPGFQYISNPDHFNKTRNLYCQHMTNRTQPDKPIIYPRGTYYFKTQFGKIIENIDTEVKIINDGLNQFIVYIMDLYNE